MISKTTFPRDVCPLCGGLMTNGTTTFTADLKAGLLVVRDVPATVCDQCGAEWLENDAADRISEFAEEMKHKGAQVEIVSFPRALAIALAE